MWVGVQRFCLLLSCGYREINMRIMVVFILQPWLPQKIKTMVLGKGMTSDDIRLPDLGEGNNGHGKAMGAADFHHRQYGMCVCILYILYIIYIYIQILSRDRGIACTLGVARTGYWPTEEKLVLSSLGRRFRWSLNRPLLPLRRCDPSLKVSSR